MYTINEVDYLLQKAFSEGFMLAERMFDAGEFEESRRQPLKRKIRKKLQERERLSFDEESGEWKKDDWKKYRDVEPEEFNRLKEANEKMNKEINEGSAKKEMAEEIKKSSPFTERIKSTNEVKPKSQPKSLLGKIIKKEVEIGKGIIKLPGKIGRRILFGK